MPASPKVFISGTTGDLGSCRKTVTDILIGKEVLPIVQEHFPPDSRTVAEMLRDKIGGCDAVICLVGTRFGAEPKERTAGEARRSYTQREYDMAVELGKPVFLFLTTPHAEVDAAPEEPLELQALQSEFRARLCSGDKVWTEFANGRELSGKVAQLRFDPESIAASLNSRLSVLLCVDLCAADEWKGRLGDDEYVREVAVPFNQLFRDILRRFADAREEQSTGHGFLATFDRVQDAVQGALMFHEALGRCTWTHGPPQARAALHLGQTMRLPGADGAPAHVVGQAVDLCRRLMTLAAGGQTLLTRPAYENASQYVRVLPAWSPSGSANLPLAPMEAEPSPPQLSWLSHGRYRFRGRAEALEVYEVGVVGRAPLAAPGDSDKARRADSAEEEQMRGWRPATGQEIPVRPGWVIDEKLGEGGFGTVWIARQTKLQERRVFKFCHDAARLQSFKRELTLARLMREELGARDDITRLHDLRLDAPPYFLESEFVPGGNLQTWIERRGGFERVSLAERVRIVAAVATATAAAHSAGIVHRDLKPTNVLMSTPEEGSRVVLSDFGIGGLADRNRLEQHGITAAGFTEKSLLELGSSRTGTRLYQPPEAAIGREASPQGDVYALGVLLYQMLVGNFHQPLGVGWDREYDAVARQAVDNSPPDEREQIADVWDLLRTDIRDTVDANVAYRLQAADEVAQRLAGLRERQAAVQNERERKRRAEQERLDQQIAEAAHAKVLEERRRSAARYRTLRRWVVGAGVLVVAFGGLAGVSYVQWQRAQANETAANAARADADAKRIAADQSAKEAKRQEDLAIAARKAAEEASADARRQAQLAKEASEIATANAARADDNAKLADQQRNVALDTLHQLVFDVQDQLEGRPALHDLRRQILNTALAGLDRISQALGAGDSRSDRLTAAAQTKTAEVYLSLGQVARGLELLRSANDTFVPLSHAAPTDAQAQRDLSISYERLGDVTLQSGDTQAALAFFQQGLEIAQKLADADPNDAQAQRDLSVSYDRLGDVTLQTGDTQAALAFFQQGLDIAQKLAAADPNDAQAQRDLSVSLTQLGSLSERSNDRLTARRYFEDALSIDRRLAEMDPRNVTSQRDLMVSHNLLGGFLQSDGDFAGAAEHFQSGIAVLDKMIAAGQNVEQSEKSRLSLQQKLQLCQVLEIAVGDWEALLKLPAESVALLLPARCTWLAKNQRTADVAQAAAHLQSLEPVTADNLYNAACGFGLCLKLVSGWDGRSDFPPKEGIPEGTPEEQAARQEYRAKALAAFQAAVAQGYDKFDDARKDADLAALHGDPEFQGLLKPTAEK